ncbi:molybdate ABC transporter permease subunit [Cohnella sp. LGH]|uniref:Molybdenum transport system permease n=1 Tax=Cohnella phaseoli TaxID=456490 RepID=A0A3D9JV55_9BACL|nr:MULTISPECIES: molybdate ABC transporter permease subunit [Cohnella]QTH45043.1 molybdate ABC transporter permease subunit [Cohnella sp. LGH]RED77427.1 molybdate transport system permease protein [Cohnella phaseoli]
MIGEVDWQTFWSPIALSLRVALLSSIAAMALGVGAARWMTRRSFAGKTLLETAFMLPLVLPPTVVGFLLLVGLGRKSWIGRFAEWLFAAPIVFSWWAAVIASVVVAFPLVYQTMKTGFLSVDKGLEEAARSSGANERQVFAYITLPLAYRSFVTAYVLGFARGFGEFGATLMIAGNIPGRTQTTPTAIYLAVDAGNATMAWLWTLSMIAVSFLLLIFARSRND